MKKESLTKELQREFKVNEKTARSIKKQFKALIQIENVVGVVLKTKFSNAIIKHEKNKKAYPSIQQFIDLSTLEKDKMIEAIEKVIANPTKAKQILAEYLQSNVKNTVTLPKNVDDNFKYIAKILGASKADVIKQVLINFYEEQELINQYDDLFVQHEIYEEQLNFYKVEMKNGNSTA